MSAPALFVLLSVDVGLKTHDYAVNFESVSDLTVMVSQVSVLWPDAWKWLQIRLSARMERSGGDTRCSVEGFS